MMQPITPSFYSGCSGLHVPVPRTRYPPAFEGKSRLAYYSFLFNSIEINSIFYKLPRHSTVVNWAETVPDDFRFTFKVSKTITHVKALDFDVKDVNDFIKTVENIGSKKGCLLAQFPPSIKIERMNGLQNLLEALGEATHNSEWKVAMEFRNSSWYEREVYELLQEYNTTLVMQDIPASATPLDEQTGEFIYLRFHGPEPRYRGTYSNEFLQLYAGYIRQWMKEGKTVFAYFNNTVGDASGNLITLNSYVREGQDSK